MSVLHPVFEQLFASLPGAREALCWRLGPALGIHVSHPESCFLASLPLPLGRESTQALQREVARVLALVKRELQGRAGAWGDAWTWQAPPDVLSVDVAFVVGEDGWECRVVEFQAFQSVAATGFLLNQAIQDQWAFMAGLRPWGGNSAPEAWLQRARTWLAPADDSVLVDVHPARQYTRWDFEASRHLFDLRVADVGMLGAQGGTCWVQEGAMRHPVGALSNRALPPDLEADPRAAALRHRLDTLPVPCFSHPAWYDRIHKGWLARLDLPDRQRCFTADRVAELPLPLSAYVLKDCRSYGGQAVRFEVRPEDLSDLAEPSHWLLQPRYQALPLFRDQEGQPVFGEARIMLGLDPAGAAWPMMAIARLTRSRMANVRGMDGSLCTGVTALYFEGAEDWDAA